MYDNRTIVSVLGHTLGIKGFSINRLSQISDSLRNFLIYPDSTPFINWPVRKLNLGNDFHSLTTKPPLLLSQLASIAP